MNYNKHTNCWQVSESAILQIIRSNSVNKNVIIGIVVAIIVVTGGVALFMMNTNKSSESTNSSESAQDTAKKYSAAKACGILTLAEAKQLMGEATTVGSNTAPANTDDINVDNCSYTNNATSVPAIRTATIMVRSALTEEGMSSNKEAFEAGGAAYPNGAEVVEGYGDKAFWDPATHQLAILDGSLWIGIVYGGTNPTANTLDDAKKVADLVVN